MTAVLAAARNSHRPALTPSASATTASPRVVLTVFVRDIDAVLAYWQEEGMLVVTGVHQGALDGSSTGSTTTGTNCGLRSPASLRYEPGPQKPFPLGGGASGSGRPISTSAL